MRATAESALWVLTLTGVCACAHGTQPVSAQASGVAVERDVSYSGRFLVDIHLPAGRGPFPVVVSFHGASGGKAAMSEFAAALAEDGFLVFNAEWLASVRPLDAAAAIRSFDAAACALRFAEARAQDYGGDASSITVIGLSAGGLAGAVVTLDGTEFEGDCDAPRSTPTVALFVGLEGQYSGATEDGGFSAAARERPDLVRRLDPRSYLDRPTPARFVLFLGDRFTPAVAPAESFLADLQAAGLAAELRHVTGPHRASTFTQGVLDLLREVR